MCPTKALIACLTMSKLKMNQHVPNKSANLLKKIGLMGTVELTSTCIFNGLVCSLHTAPGKLQIN